MLLQYLLYILTSVWVLRNPNAGRNSHFQRFLWKISKYISSKFLQKTCFNEFAPKCWSTVLFPKKRAFFSKNTFLPMKFIIVQSLEYYWFLKILPRSSVCNEDLLFHVNPHNTLEKVHKKCKYFSILVQTIQ